MAVKSYIVKESKKYPVKTEHFYRILAEGVRFELTVGFPITSFQDWLLKPLGQPSVFGAI